MTGADWTEGIVLRYGGFYGPGHLARRRTASTVEPIRKRKFPVVGDGAGVWSFIHIEDAAEATVAAVERGRRGIYNIVDDEPAPRRGVAARRRARRSARKPPRHVPRWLGPAARRRGRDGHDDRGARSLERQGQARAGLAAAAPELARGLRRGGRMSEPHDELLDELRPAAFAIAYRMLGSVAEAEDVVQEALLRVHRALEEGERIESPRAYVATVATRLAIDQLRSARVAPRDATSASGCPSRSSPTRRDDPARAGRDGRLAVARVPRAAREPVARAAGGAAAARRVRLRLRRDRRDRRQERGQHAPARARARAGTSRSAGRASRPRASSATSWRGASSPPPATATSARSRRCSPRTSSCTATAAARRRRSPARCRAARGSRGRCWPGCGRAPRIAGRVDAPRSRSTASRARCCSTASGGVISVMALDIADGQIQGDPLDRQPRQARPRRPGGGPAGAAGPERPAGVASLADASSHPPFACGLVRAVRLRGPFTSIGPPKGNG